MSGSQLDHHLAGALGNACARSSKSIHSNDLANSIGVFGMTKADLVELVTAQIAQTAGPTISKKDCARVVDTFLDAIKDALREQQNIEVRGFGTFKIRQRKTRMARNPRTGSPVEVAARPVPVFKPSKELRALIADIDVSELTEA